MTRASGQATSPSPPSRLPAAATAPLPIIAVRKGAAKVTADLVAAEQPLTLFVNGSELFTILCSPGNLEELALGYVVSEGLVRSAADIANMVLDAGRGQVFIRLREGLPFDRESFDRHRTLSSGCARGITLHSRWEESGMRPVAAPFDIGSAALIDLMTRFLQMSEHHHETGCIHVAALADGSSLRVFREDIGRHNAIDKVVGAALAQQIPIGRCALLVSGRISSEMVLKAARLRVPLIATRAAVTDAAVRIATRAGLTLVGFVRAQRVNIYAHPWRIADAAECEGELGDDDDAD